MDTQPPSSEKKVDLSTERPLFFKAKTTPQIVDLPPAKYLSIEGQGEPGGEAFQEAISAMYAVAFTTKMRMKQHGRDFRVSTLEALWWSDEEAIGAEAFLATPRTSWKWRLLMMVPDFVNDAELRETRDELAAQKRGGRRAAEVSLLTLHEGRCIQAMHVGPYDTEAETIAKMQERMREEGVKPKGKHHEIYLGDPRTSKPEKLRTILRQPVM